MIAWWKGFNTQLSAPRLDSVTNHQDLPGVKTGLSKRRRAPKYVLSPEVSHSPNEGSNDGVFGIKKKGRRSEVGGKNRNKVDSQLVVLLVSSTPSSGAFRATAWSSCSLVLSQLKRKLNGNGNQLIIKCAMQGCYTELMFNHLSQSRIRSKSRIFLSVHQPSVCRDR